MTETPNEGDAIESGRKPSSIARWFGRVVNGTAVLAFLVGMLGMAIPGVVGGVSPVIWLSPAGNPSYQFLIYLFFGLWLGAGVGWLLLLVGGIILSGSDRPSGSRHRNWLGWLLAPGLGVVLIVIGYSGIPLRASIWLYQGSLQELLDEARTMPEQKIKYAYHYRDRRDGTPRWVGLYAVDAVEVVRGPGTNQSVGYIYINVDQAYFLRPPRLIFDPQGVKQASERWSLGQGWYWDSFEE